MCLVGLEGTGGVWRGLKVWSDLDGSRGVRKGLEGSEGV